MNDESKPLKFALLGAGFWARYQLAAWQEVAGAQCVAVADRTLAKAERLASEFSIPQATGDAEALLQSATLDFVDIVTDVASHAHLVELAAANGTAAICQKPLATSLAEAEQMVAACRQAGVPLLVHENWRWQTPIRAVRDILASQAIGQPFRARVDMISGFPVFKNQPSLRELDQFILTDLGTHILDVARFLFGEASALYCQTHRIHADIRGEDVATVVTLHNHGRTTVTCNMAYAENHVERECFPQTLLFIEGSAGSLEVLPNYELRLTTAAGTASSFHPPRLYPWVDPAYAVVQSSIVDCHGDLVRGLRNPEQPPETTAADNLKTLRLVFAAYESATAGRAIAL